MSGKTQFPLVSTKTAVHTDAFLVKRYSETQQTHRFEKDIVGFHSDLRAFRDSLVLEVACLRQFLRRESFNPTYGVRSVFSQLC